METQRIPAAWSSATSFSKSINAITLCDRFNPADQSLEPIELAPDDCETVMGDCRSSGSDFIACPANFTRLVHRERFVS